MQKGRKFMLENRLSYMRPKRKLGCKMKKGKKKTTHTHTHKKVSDHRVPQILKTNKNMLTFHLPAKNKAKIDKDRYSKMQGSQDKRPVPMKCGKLT